MSPSRQLEFLDHVHSHVQHQGSQYVIAMHSPIVMAHPNSTIYQLSRAGINPIRYEDTEHYKITKQFLNDPMHFLTKYAE